MTTELADLLKEDILTLGMRADEARRKLVPFSRVWYQRIHIVHASDVSRNLAVPDAASEVRVLGTPARFEEALSIVRAVKDVAGSRRVAAFSLAEVVDKARGGWGDPGGLFTQLARAGLDDFAEVPADLLPDLNSDVALARAYGLSAMRLTIAKPVGDHKVEVLDRMYRCKTGVGGIERVNPLPRHMPTDKPTTGYEDIRMVALARLAFSEFIAAPVFIEVDWSLYGLKLAQVALTFGADFLDAVPATTDPSLGPRRGTVQEVERNIRAAGFEPQEYRPQ